jgi:hypothetical protein
MAAHEHTMFHFSQANPRGKEQDSVPALLRRVAETLDEFGNVQVFDLVLHSEITSDGESWPSLTVYYADRDETRIGEQPTDSHRLPQ